jgi:P27 family predicted phage terminase small subunit
VRGRKPKPTRRKQLEGFAGKRRRNRREPKLPPFQKPQAPPAAPAAPAPVNGEAVPTELLGDAVATAEWLRTVPMLREREVITEGDRGSLIALCQQWSVYQEAVAKWRALGMIVKAPSGYPMVNPYLGVANKALNQCLRLWAELGLTPSSRARVTTLPPTGVNDPFAEFDGRPPSGR